MKSQGLRIDSINAIGGISKKVPFVMQTLADVLGMPIRIVRSEQTCALGAAMFAAVAAGIYPTVSEAMKYMGSDIEVEYKPDAGRVTIYETLYRKYLELAKNAEIINVNASTFEATNLLNEDFDTYRKTPDKYNVYPSSTAI